MLGWGRKRDGFEWHKYVRTTIKLRRENRKAKIDGARQAAVDGLASAGRAGLAAGSTGFDVLLQGARAALIAAFQLPGQIAEHAARLAGPALAPILSLLRRPGMRPVLALLGTVAVASALARWRAIGPDREGLLILAAGATALLGVALASSWSHVRWPAPIARAAKSLAARFPVLKKVSPARALALGGGACAAATAAVIWLVPGSGMHLASFVPLPSLTTTTLEGKASVVSGDVLRIKDKVVQISGIEAPDREQRCTKGGKRWRCGEAAADALGRLVRAKTIRCEVGSADSAGQMAGTCSVDGKDIAAALTREGAVFASGGLFSSYGSIEREARAQKAGLWAGEAQRPSEHRAKLWEAARKAAPDGCPIKGVVSGDGKTYLLPWSAEYVRARVRTQRGERWFCTESEARAAGWKSAVRG